MQRTCYKLKGYLLLQCLIVIILIIILISNNNYYYNYINSLQEKKQLTGLNKFQQLFLVAQYKSILLGKKVYLCPTLDTKKCVNNWNKGIMIFTLEDPNDLESQIQVLHHDNHSMFIDRLLRINFFGSNQLIQKLTFLPNGMLNNNGNFCIYNKFNKSHCLYFNQAGKTYIIKK